MYGIKNQRRTRLSKKSVMRLGASRKSSAFRVGGVSMTIKSKPPSAWSS
jgi:hypothetical protein